MKNLFPILLFFSFLASTDALMGADISVSMTTDKTQVAEGDQFEVQVSVQGSRSGETPEILNSENFEIQGSGQSSQIQVINGQMSQQLIFNFVLSPKKSGKFRLGPARVQVSGKSFESSVIDITVTKEQQNATGGGGGSSENRNLFYIVGEVDNKNPYVNEQITYTFKFYNRAPLTNAQLGLPDFKGFLKEGPDKEKEVEQITNGVRWQVTSLHFALFPFAPGTLTIDPTRLVADAIMRSQRGDSLFDDFFAMNRTKRISLRSEPITIVVSPLPTAARPANFSGLVGHFDLKTSLGKTALAVGDSSTMTVTLEGNGNLRDFQMPPLASNDFKVYDDQPMFDIKQGQPWKGTKVFKRALVPLKAGALSVPSVQITYFDTASKSYKTLESQKLVVNATGTLDDSIAHVASTGEANSKKTIEVVGKDLMPIKRAPSSLRSDMLTPMQRRGILLFCFSGVFLYALLFALKKRNDNFASNIGLGRKQKAFREFNARLKTLNRDGAFFEEASLLLREYLGNKFNLDGKAITPMDAERKLSPYKISKESIKKIEGFLRACEAGQYGGTLKGNDKSSEQSEILASIVNGIESEVRR
jgi:hypothetical protein